MGNKRFAKDPLLYIHQPTIKKTEAPMQSGYITPKMAKGAVTNEAPPANPAPKQPVKQTSFEKHFSKPEPKQEAQPKRKSNHFNQTEQAEITEETEEIEETEDTEDVEGARENDKPLKFKDMTIDQKVAYFVNSSSFAPKMRCEVKTEEKAYRGIIIDKIEEDVHMRIGKRVSVTKIPIVKINSIRMLGF